jgi:hypothetical protein
VEGREKRTFLFESVSVMSEVGTLCFCAFSLSSTGVSETEERILRRGVLISARMRPHEQGLGHTDKDDEIDK